MSLRFLENSIISCILHINNVSKALDSDSRLSNYQDNKSFMFLKTLTLSSSIAHDSSSFKSLKQPTFKIISIPVSFKVKLFPSSK